MSNGSTIDFHDISTHQKNCAYCENSNIVKVLLLIKNKYKSQNEYWGYCKNIDCKIFYVTEYIKIFPKINDKDIPNYNISTLRCTNPICSKLSTLHVFYYNDSKKNLESRVKKNSNPKARISNVIKCTTCGLVYYLVFREKYSDFAFVPIHQIIQDHEGREVKIKPIIIKKRNLRRKKSHE